MNPRYKFLLSIDGDTPIVVNPIWKELNMDFAKESQQQFFRRKLSGKLTFVRGDYELIYDCLFHPSTGNFDTKFGLSIQVDYGSGYGDYWSGVFYATDCDFNVDDKTIIVTPAVDDKYVNILAGLEKEFNMIDLKPTITPIKMKLRPIIQVFIQSPALSARVGCVLGGNYWEQDANYEYDMDKVSDTYHFGQLAQCVKASITKVPDTGQDIPVPSNFNGLWQHALFTESGLTFHGFQMEKNVSLTYRYRIEWIPVYSNGRWYPDRCVVQIKNLEALDIIINEGEENEETIHVPALTRMWYGTGFMGDDAHTNTLAAQGALSGKICDLSCTLEPFEAIFGRIVLNKTTYNGNNTYDIPQDDMVLDNRNYKYCYPLEDLYSYLEYSEQYSVLPTKWGRYEANKYYIPPTNDLWIPLAKSSWDGRSFWIMQNQVLVDYEEDGRTSIELKNAYPLDEVIGLLLDKVAPELEMGYTNFLSYKQDNVKTDYRKMFITPKSNIKKIDYDIAAVEAPITLKAIFDMLRDCYRAYWYIDSNNKLRIEQIQFFRNGYDYDPTHLTYDIDLTQRIVSRSGKAWAFGLNKFNFDKPELTSRYEFGWMDEQTAPFNGEPLNVIGGFVEQGKVDKIDINLFSSDVDFIMANPADISDDGFVLMAAQNTGTTQNPVWRLPIVEAVPYSYTYLQNAFCSFTYLESYYLKDFPSKKYKIGDGITQSGADMMKIKTQEVSFPCSPDPDMQKLIKTSIGNGQIEKLSINLSSRNGKATLKYEP